MQRDDQAFTPKEACPAMTSAMWAPTARKEFQDAISGAPSAAEKNKEKRIKQRRNIAAAPNLGHRWGLDAMSRLPLDRLREQGRWPHSGSSRAMTLETAGNKVLIL
jgi:hypothetical protein